MILLHSTPLAQRPREKLQQKGAEQLELKELVAVLLGTGYAGHDVLELSRRVVEYLQNNQPSYVNLASIPGIGPAKSAEILAALQLFPALEKEKLTATLHNPEQIFKACQDMLELPQEQVVVFYLTVHQQSLARETVSLGTLSASLVHPREVFRPAIMHNAAHIILAHNHPSGSTLPSQADLEVTQEIAIAGKQLGIELVDHVICAKQGYTSLRAGFPDLFLLG